MRGHGGSLSELCDALLGGNAELLEEQLQAFVTNVLSFHDTGAIKPERVYQGFVVGLLAVLEPGYQVRSNRESGYGRPDVLIRPVQPGKPGAVLELKVARPGKRTLAQALAEGSRSSGRTTTAPSCARRCTPSRWRSMASGCGSRWVASARGRELGGAVVDRRDVAF